MLQSNTANRANKAKSENVTVNGKQILVTMIARISRDQKLGFSNGHFNGFLRIRI